jgi:hypothetical protein
MYLEYKLHMTDGGMRTPLWIADGGYFVDPDSHTMIGWSPDESAREYYVPDTVTSYTQAELVTVVQGIHSRYPIKNEDESDMTNAEVAAFVNAWCAEKG